MLFQVVPNSPLVLLDFEPNEFKQVGEMAREAGSVRLDAGTEWWSTLGNIADQR